MINGYARVSNDGQDPSNQTVQPNATQCFTIFREKMTGTQTELPRVKTLRGKLSTADVVIISAVDRLSREATDLFVITRDMLRAGAGLRSIAEPVVATMYDIADLAPAFLGVAAKLDAVGSLSALRAPEPT